MTDDSNFEPGELRRDPVTGATVIYALSRGKRPYDFRKRKDEVRKGPCPFCPGNEQMTPAERDAFRGEPGEGEQIADWQVRVFPNKFPIMPFPREGHEIVPLPPGGDALYVSSVGVGAHEVVVETPIHDIAYHDFPASWRTRSLRMYRNRLAALNAIPGIRFVQIFKNNGQRAGASLVHEHSQILGLPFVPTQIDAELRGSLAHFERTGRNVFDDIVAEELRSGERVLRDDERFLAVVPYAARAPLECWIIPKFPGADFAETTDDDLARVGDILHELVHRVDGLQPHFPFNMVVHTAPAGLDDHTFYRWHIELMPRAGALAGFELGTGVYINAMAPEDAARQLRDVAIDG